MRNPEDADRARRGLPSRRPDEQAIYDQLLDPQDPGKRHRRTERPPLHSNGRQLDSGGRPVEPEPPATSAESPTD